MATTMAGKILPHHTADVHQVKPAASAGGEAQRRGGRSEASSRSHLLDELFQVGGGTCWTAQSTLMGCPQPPGASPALPPM